VGLQQLVVLQQSNACHVLTDRSPTQELLLTHTCVCQQPPPSHKSVWMDAW
jgi:hypothetical protein